MGNQVKPVRHLLASIGHGWLCCIGHALSPNAPCRTLGDARIQNPEIILKVALEWRIQVHGTYHHQEPIVLSFTKFRFVYLDMFARSTYLLTSIIKNNVDTYFVTIMLVVTYHLFTVGMLFRFIIFNVVNNLNRRFSHCSHIWHLNAQNSMLKISFSW